MDLEIRCDNLNWIQLAWESTSSEDNSGLVGVLIELKLLSDCTIISLSLKTFFVILTAVFLILSIPNFLRVRELPTINPLAPNGH